MNECITKKVDSNVLLKEWLNKIYYGNIKDTVYSYYVNGYSSEITQFLIDKTINAVEHAYPYINSILDPKIVNTLLITEIFSIVFGPMDDRVFVCRLFNELAQDFLGNGDISYLYEEQPEFVNEVEKILGINGNTLTNTISSVRDINKEKGSGRTTSFGVRDIETGQIWSTQDDCVNDIKPANTSHLSAYKNLNAHLNGRTKQCYGRKFERVSNEKIKEIVAKKQEIAQNSK